MHLYPTDSATYLIILVFPAEVGPSSKTGRSVPAIARKKSFKCSLKVSVKWKIYDTFYLNGPYSNKNPDIYKVPGRILGIVSLKNCFKSYFSPNPSMSPS